MLNLRMCSAIATLLIGSATVLADDQVHRTMNVSLAHNDDQNQAVIWVADGTSFDALAAVARAVTESGYTEIAISVEPTGSEPNPMHAAGDHHVGIRFSGERAELFLSTDIPFRFAQSLSVNLRQLSGVSDVTLRSVATKSGARKHPAGSDPFESTPTTSVAPQSKPSTSDDPFAR